MLRNPPDPQRFLVKTEPCPASASWIGLAFPSGCRVAVVYPAGLIMRRHQVERNTVNNIIYIVGLVVVVLAVLAFFGLR